MRPLLRFAPLVGKVLWLNLGFVLMVWNYAVIPVSLIMGDIPSHILLIGSSAGWTYALISLWLAVRQFKKGGVFVWVLWLNIIILGGPITFVVLSEVPRWIRAII